MQAAFKGEELFQFWLNMVIPLVSRVMEARVAIPTYVLDMVVGVDEAMALGSWLYSCMSFAGRGTCYNNTGKMAYGDSTNVFKTLLIHPSDRCYVRTRSEHA